MSNTVKAVMDAAQSWRNRPFSSAHYGVAPYCASFVRWCFEQANGIRLGLPVVSEVPYYKAKGIHNSVGEWFADSMAGNAVGPAVKSQQPGDLLFFRDTCRGNWAIGSITHVGIAIDSGERMADAGGGSFVNFRSHRATFPGQLVEIRRPRVIGGGTADDSRRTAISILRGNVSGMVRGKHVRDVAISISRIEALKANRNGAYPRESISQEADHDRPQRGSKSHIEFFINNQQVKPVQSFSVDLVFGGQHLKQFGHDHMAQTFLNGAVQSGDGTVKVEVKNGAAHVWVDGKEVKPESAKIELIV